MRGSPQKALKKTVEYELITSNGLNDRQLFFCMYYVKYWNATKAYQKAYQCDYVTANRNAHRIMVNEGIREEIVRLKKQLADSVMLDARQVLQKYIDIAFADITDFVEFSTKTYTTKEYVGTNAVVSKSVRKYADKNKHYEISTLLVRVCRKQVIETTKMVVFFYNDNPFHLSYDIGRWEVKKWKRKLLLKAKQKQLKYKKESF